MQQYDLLSRFSVHFEQPRAVNRRHHQLQLMRYVPRLRRLTGSMHRVPDGSVRRAGRVKQASPAERAP